jgi:type VI secretion system secreted protein Hcp
MAIYLAWDDGSITGDVADSAFTGWIELGSFQWGVGRGITAAASSPSDREGTTPSVSEIVVTKMQDSSSGNLMRASTASPPVNQGKLVHIVFASSGSGAASEAYIKFDLENTLVSGWSMSSGGDRPSESVTLNFTKVTMTVTPSGATTTSSAPDTPFYDLAQQTGG